MCNCLDNVTDEMTKHVVDLNEGGVLQGRLVQKVYPISSGNIKAPTTYTDFQYTVVPIKKDGSEGKPKRKTIRLPHTYCPFCGEKHNSQN